MVELGGFEFGVAFGAVGIAALLQGSIGFGFGLVAAPVLLALDPSWVPASLLVAGLPLSLLIGWQDRKVVQFRALVGPLGAQVLGVSLGVWVLGMIEPNHISILVAAMVLLAVLLSVMGLPLRPTPPLFLAAGTLAGFMGTTSTIPGPPLALIHQHLSPREMRGTLAPFFVVANGAALFGLIVTGKMSLPQGWMGLALIPAVLMGFLLARFLSDFLDPHWVRPAVLLFSFLAASGLLYRQI